MQDPSSQHTDYSNTISVSPIPRPTSLRVKTVSHQQYPPPISQGTVSLTWQEPQPSPQIPRFLPDTSRTWEEGMVGESTSCLSWFPRLLGNVPPLLPQLAAGCHGRPGLSSHGANRGSMVSTSMPPPPGPLGLPFFFFFF